MVILGLVWRDLLSTHGMVNNILSFISGAEVVSQWLGNPKTVLWTIILVDTWIFAGTNMILWLAGLLAIPSDLIDAAKIDGANVRQLVGYVVIPEISHVISLSLLLNVIGGFQAFAIVYVLTRGGPAHFSELLSTYVFWIAFFSDGPQRFGYASAISVVMIIILLTFSFIRIKLSRVL